MLTQNARTHVLEVVESIVNVVLLIMLQIVFVFLVILEIHIQIATLFKKNVRIFLILCLCFLRTNNHAWSRQWYSYIYFNKNKIFINWIYYKQPQHRWLKILVIHLHVARIPSAKKVRTGNLFAHAFHQWLAHLLHAALNVWAVLIVNFRKLAKIIVVSIRVLMQIVV